MIIFIIFTDEDLIKIQSRDQFVFEKIYKEYKTKIYNYLVIKTKGNTELAEELFSDTFHSAWASAPKLRNMKNMQSWLLCIANRRFIDHLRGKYRDRYLISEESVYKTDYPGEADYEIKNNDRVIMTKLALNNLNDKYKKILTMKYIENKSQEEIAGMINKTVPSVQSILFRARESLKKELLKITEG